MANKPLANWSEIDGIPRSIAMTVASYAALLAATSFPGKTEFDANDLEKLVLLSDCEQVWRMTGFDPPTWDLDDEGPNDYVADFAVVGALSSLTNLSSSTFDVGRGTLAAGKRVLSADAGGTVGLFVLASNGANWDLSVAPDLSADGQVRTATVLVRFGLVSAKCYLQIGTSLSTLEYTPVSSDPVIWAGPPEDGTHDSWADVAAVVAAAPAGSIVKLRKSNYPYICDHTRVEAKSGVTLDLNGNTISSTSTYSLGTCPIGSAPENQAKAAVAIATLNGAVAEGATSIVVTWADTRRLVKGDYFWISTAKGGRVSFQVTNVATNTITLEAPVLFSIPTSSQVVAYDPVIGFKLLFNGATVLATFDGTVTDNRWCEMIACRDCVMSGPGTVQQVAGTANTPSIALLGFDLGGWNNHIEDIKFVGMDGTASNYSGAAIEGNRNSGTRKISSVNLGYTLWVNSTYDSLFDDVKCESGCGPVLASSINVASPDVELGPHRNTFRGLKAINVVGNTGAIRTGPDFCDNEITDLTVENGSAYSTAAVILGANGTLGCNRNHFGRVKIKNISSALYYGNACVSKDNVVDVLLLDGAKTLATMAIAGQSMEIGTVRGTIDVPESLLSVVTTAALRTRSVEIASSDGPTFSSKKALTLNGATAVYMPAPWLTSSSRVSLARTAAGGSSHGVPTYAFITNTSSATSLSGWSGVGLASFDGTTMTEGTGTSGHEITQLPAVSNYVRGPAIFRVTIKPTGRTWAALTLGSGTSTVYFNLTTGAVGTATGPGTVGYATLNADGSCSCVMYTDDMDTAQAYIWMASAQGVLSYTGTGATFVLSNFSITGLHAVSLVAEANNSDVYSVTVQ
jgi:hypothetical protein